MVGISGYMYDMFVWTIATLVVDDFATSRRFRHFLATPFSLLLGVPIYLRVSIVIHCLNPG